jgi:glycosyltransferase involved in cell wall biosynthesis
MKILFCAYDRPGHIATGPNAWIQRLIPDLLSNKLDVVTHFFYEGNKGECPTIDYFEKNNIPYKASKLEKLPYTELQVKEVLKQVKNLNITVLVANLVIPAFYAAKYLKEFNIPVVPVLHSNDEFYRGVIKKFVNDKNSGITDSVSVSNLINTYITDNNQNKAHLVIPCGTPKVAYKSDTFTNKLKVIYAGRIEVVQKQILLLTEAFIKCSKKLQTIDFNIYGNGRYQNEVVSLIDNSASHNVCFKGAVPPSEIQKTMAQHHIFTLMSDYEGMPIALMEAMACGLVPVCLSEKSGINEIIEHGINGFIVNNREDDYQDKLKLLQDDPELWNTMSRNAIKTIEDKYSTKITHKKWADLLNSLKNIQTQKIHIPHKIKLDAEPLVYGDNRKPALLRRLKINMDKQWMQLRLIIRPRARFNKIFS